MEFAFIIPVMMLVVIGIIEFAIAFNTTLAVNRASQDAALIASEAGNLPGADCMILRSIEGDISAPSDKREITGIQIQRTNPSGTTVFANNSYTRSGATSAPWPTVRMSRSPTPPREPGTRPASAATSWVAVRR